MFTVASKLNCGLSASPYRTEPRLETNCCCRELRAHRTQESAPCSNSPDSTTTAQIHLTRLLDHTLPQAYSPRLRFARESHPLRRGTARCDAVGRSVADRCITHAAMQRRSAGCWETLPLFSAPHSHGPPTALSLTRGKPSHPTKRTTIRFSRSECVAVLFEFSWEWRRRRTSDSDDDTLLSTFASYSLRASATIQPPARNFSDSSLPRAFESPRFRVYFSV